MYLCHKNIEEMRIYNQYIEETLNGDKKWIYITVSNILVRYALLSSTEKENKGIYMTKIYISNSDWVSEEILPWRREISNFRAQFLNYNFKVHKKSLKEEKLIQRWINMSRVQRTQRNFKYTLYQRDHYKFMMEK